jgi:hypothetical protein
MKLLPILFAIALASCATTKNTSNTIDRVVKASCGTCNFDMTADECELAVEIDGKYYFVEGSSVDGHGDAHNETGLCSVVREAKVVGEIKHGVFVAAKFELIDVK